MHGRVYASLVLFSLLMVGGGKAQGRADNEKPVWTMEIMKVKPGKLEPTLNFLDNNRMRILEEAKRQGVLLNYHRILDSDKTTVLLTEYKNQAAYDERGKLFALVIKQLPPLPGKHVGSHIVILNQHDDLYETVRTGVFIDSTDEDIARFQLLAKD